MNIDRLADALATTGIPSKAARVLAYLIKIDEASTKQIISGAGLRQPEVSVSTTWLRDQGWILQRVSKSKYLGRGRPLQLYRMAVQPSELMDQINTRALTEVNQIMDNLIAIKDELP